MVTAGRLESSHDRPIESVYEGVDNGLKLGEGLTGVVRIGIHKQTGAKVAIKAHEIAKMESLLSLKEEIAILHQLNHPNVVGLEAVYQNNTHIYVVRELCSGGDLFGWLDKQPDYHFSETACIKMAKDILNAVHYIHSKGVIHRDIKLEVRTIFVFLLWPVLQCRIQNILLADKSDSPLKLVGFDVAKYTTPGEVLHEAVGTPYTVAPEVINLNYNHKCDIWSVGVIVYMLLCGDPPFGGINIKNEDLKKVTKNILKGRFQFEPKLLWNTVSESGKDFIQFLLTVDPARRPTAEEALKHRWLSLG